MVRTVVHMLGILLHGFCTVIHCSVILACMSITCTRRRVAPDQQFFDLQGQSFEGQLEQPPETTEQPVSQDQGKYP